MKLFCLRFKYNDVFSFIQDILIPLLYLVNVFAYTEKGQQFGEIFETKKFSVDACT